MLLKKVKKHVLGVSKKVTQKDISSRRGSAVQKRAELQIHLCHLVAEKETLDRRSKHSVLQFPHL